MWKWLLTAFIFICLIAVGIMLEKPKGNLVGKVLLEKQLVNSSKTVYSIDNIKGSNLRVLAYGAVTRGSFVNEKGEYKLDGLPVGTYSLVFKANGYRTNTEWGIEVKEAKDTKVPEVKMNFLTPEVSIGSDSTVFSPKEDPYFWFRASAIDDVDVKVYNFDPLKLINEPMKDKSDYFSFLLGNYYYGLSSFFDKSVEDQKPVLECTKNIYYDSSDYGRANLKIDKKLPAGAYLMVANGKSKVDNKDYKDYYWFTVSDIGVITKHAPGKILVRAVNFTTLKSEPGVSVKLYDRYNKTNLIAEVETNADGLATIDMSAYAEDNYQSMLVVAQKADSIAVSGSYTWYYAEDRYKIYTYTDRPIYRPNQTVYFKGVIREEKSGLMENMPNKPVKVTVYNPDSEVISTYKLTTNKFGTYSAYISLPKNAVLGAYRIETNIDSNPYDSYFEVAEYRKPEYKVDVIPGSELIIAGDKAKATIKANYYFGYPVTNAKVKYTVYSSPDYGYKWNLLPRPEYYAYYDDWDEDDEYYDYGSSSGEIVAEGYATTDDNGEAIIEFKTKKVDLNNDKYYSYSDSMAQKYKVEAEVTDISRKVTTGSNSFDVVSGKYAVFIESKSYVTTPGKDLKVNVSAIDFDKKNVSVPVKLELQSWEWNREEWEYSNPRVVSTTEVHTDDKGKAVATLSVPKNANTSNYKIVAYSKDNLGNIITAVDYVWVSDYDYNDDENSNVQPKLQMTFDKKVYQYGDKAKVMLVSPVKDVQALVCMEGTELFNCKVIDMKSNTYVFDLPIEKKYIPNAYLSVVIVGKNRQYYSLSKMVKVSPDIQFLNIDVKADKSRYKPQDKATFDIKVTDHDGKPVKAELSAAVVDESIFAIRDDSTPNIRKFFFNKKANYVQTSYSFYKRYSAGGEKIQPHLRKDFKDTAYWNANLVTDDKGEAKVTFTIPDNLTTWRLTLRGITTDTKVGSAIDKILVTQDIIVRLALPRFYTVGDKAILASIVHNYTDDKQDIQVKLELPDNFKVAGSGKKTEVFVQVPAQDKVRQDWNIEALKVGDVKVRAYALSSKIKGDAVEQPISILPYGVPINDIISGDITESEGNKEINTKVDGKAVDGSVNWQVRVSASNASMIFGSLEYLIQYPYGCTEQTMSKLMPSVVVANVANGLGVQLSPKARKMLPDVIDDSKAILYKNQHSDGGWGWWENDESRGYMTAYVLHGAKLVDESSYVFDMERAHRGLNWLTKYFESDSVIKASKQAENTSSKDWYNHTSDDLAYECYVYALYDSKNDIILNNLYDRKKTLSNEALAYLSLAYAELGNTKKAQDLIDTIMSRVDVALPILSFGMSQKLLEKFGLSLAPLYSYNDVEISAIVLRAMLKVKPHDPVVDQIVPLLMEKRHGNYWANTKTTSAVILSLADYIKVRGMEESPDYDVSVKLENKVIANYHFDKTNMFDPEKVVTIPSDQVKDLNKLVIEKTGDGKMYYSSNFSYYKFYNTEDTIPAETDNGVVIKKEFFKLVSKTDSEGVIKYQKAPFNGVAKAGEVLLLKLTVANTDFGQYILLEDPKASGMEVVSVDPEEDMGSDFDESGDDLPYWWVNWWTHQSDKDTHMAFFISDLNKGSHEIYYLVRPELPGEYLIRPTTITGMYSNVLSGSTESTRIKVEE
ncbi:MAG: MG2 domain-containing protein [Vampirovibrionia bacterium]